MGVSFGLLVEAENPVLIVRFPDSGNAGSQYQDRSLARNRSWRVITAQLSCINTLNRDPGTVNLN